MIAREMARVDSDTHVTDGKHGWGGSSIYIMPAKKSIHKMRNMSGDW
jgi:hypothetical protein